MEKQALRERIWDRLEEEGIARFPFPPHDRIPNFDGREAAADRLADTPEWVEADALKCNPDAPQRPVRRRALEAGKTVYVAVPRLRDPDPFVELDPARVGNIDNATTVSGASEEGRTVGPGAMPAIDLVVSGSVAVREDGARIGKGEGYSDLEWGVLSSFGLVGPGTTVATTVHGIQVVDDEWSVDDHDVPLDLVATPDRLVRTDTPYARPAGVDFAALGDRIEAMPVLERLREREGEGETGDHRGE